MTTSLVLQHREVSYEKNNYSAKLLILILTVFLVILALPVSAFAAKKEKKLKSVKTYRNGKLINSYEFSYNKNGLETKETFRRCMLSY